MPVAPLFNVPKNDADWLRLLWFNYDHHRNVSEWISQNKNIAVETFVLYPPPPAQDFGAWSLNHQSWHTQIDSILQVRSNNLLLVDINDPNTLAAWVFLHATEHQAWQTATGVP